MLNEYFRKWCCIIVVDHISVHGRLENSLDDSSVNRLNSFVQQLNCNCYVYTDKNIVSEYFTIFKLTNNSSSIVEYAFQTAFDNGFRKVILLDISRPVTYSILEEAFSCLKMIEFCMGPMESSCYLFGMNFFEKDFFSSLPAVFLSDKKVLIRKAGERKFAVYKTPMLKTEDNLSVTTP